MPNDAIMQHFIGNNHKLSVAIVVNKFGNAGPSGIYSRLSSRGMMQNCSSLAFMALIIFIILNCQRTNKRAILGRPRAS